MKENEFIAHLPPMMSKAEEQNIYRRVMQGDEAAKKIAVERNLRLVMSIAKRHAPPELRLDAFQEGVFGLFDALNHYDMDTGFRFSTYATCWIKRSIHLFLEREPRVAMYVPSYVARRCTRLRKYAQCHGIELIYLTCEDVRLALGPEESISDDRAKELIGIVNRKKLSLDMTSRYADGHDKDPLTERLGTVPDEMLFSDFYEEFEWLSKTMGSLTTKEQNFLTLRFKEMKTHAEIAEVFGVSANAVSQFERRIIRILRSRMTSSLAA